MLAPMSSESMATVDAVEADGFRIAAQLSLPIGIVEMLQERNMLVRFDLSDREIRERLWQAHARWALRKVTRRSRSLAP
jgi:hypothetical protein